MGFWDFGGVRGFFMGILGFPRHQEFYMKFQGNIQGGSGDSKGFHYVSQGIPGDIQGTPRAISKKLMGFRGIP